VITVLGNVAKIGTGQSAPQNSSVFTNEGNPFIRAGSLEKLLAGENEDMQEKIQPEIAKKYKLKLFQKDTIVFAKSGMSAKLGRVYRLKKPCYVVSHLATIEPSRNLDSGYLHRWFQANPPSKLINNDAYPSIKTSVISAIEIPLPPLDEQKRIAAILDKADSIRRKRQQAIKLADEFLRAVFLDMFGDPITNPKGFDEYSLMDIADIRSGVTKGKQIDLSKAITLPYMRVANVQDGYLDLSNIQQITVSPNDAKKCQLEKGDILLTEGGDPDKLGRGYIWNNEIENCIHQNHIFSVRIKEKEKIRPEFLNAVIASQRGKKYFLKVGKQTTGIATINKTVLSEFVPFIPPVEIQDKFVELATKIKRIKSKYSVLDLNLFNSLSQKAFSGEL